MRLVKILLLPAILFIFSLQSMAQYVQPMRYPHYSIPEQVNIGAGVVRVTEPSAYLEIGPTSGGTKGLLPPRMTTTQRNAIASPAAGLMIYNTTTNQYNYYNGSAWSSFSTGGGSGSGITQLGAGLWLTQVNDSTYSVDTATANTFYRSLFPQLTGSYANPSWITSLAWSKITGTPTIQSTRFDSSYTPIGGNRGSEYIVKSVRIRKNNITVTPTQVGDSAMYWNIDVPIPDSLKQDGDTLRLYFTGANDLAVYNPATGGSGTNNANIGSGYRWLNPGTQEMRTFFAGLYTTLDSSSNTNGLTVKIDTASMFPAIRATISGGGGASVPSGNFGNGVVIRNGALAVPGSDSLNFSGGLSIKGTLSATALPTGGVAADSVVVVDAAGVLKKRNVSAFPSGTGTNLQVALWNGTSTITGHQRYTWTNSNDYPSLIIGAGSGVTYGASIQFRSVVGDYGSISSDGNQIGFYGLTGSKVLNFYSHSGGSLMLTLQRGTGGSLATFRKTAISVDTAVGGPSIGSIHGEYAAGDSTTSATDVGRHMFRGIGRTYANVGSFNTFYSTVSATNTNAGITQDHIVSWQSDAEKSGASTLNIIYEGAMLATQIKGGTVGKKYGWKYWDANVYAGARLGSQMAFKTDKLKAASGLNFHFLADSSHYAQLDGNMMIGDTTLAASARKTIHLFNGTAPTGNISGTIIYSESGEFKVRNASGAINLLSGDAIFSGSIKTGDPGSGAVPWKFGNVITTSSLVLSTTRYVETKINGSTVWLAVVDPPSPSPKP